MTTDRHHWHRTDDHGIDVQFTVTTDERGNVTLTLQELEGLMRTGGWEPGPTPQALTFEQRIADLARVVASTGHPAPKETP